MKVTERIRENAQNLLGNRPVVIGFLGDSVTQGCFELYDAGNGSLESECRSYEAYHHKLKRMLEEVFPTVPINVINGGIGGDTAPSGKERLARDILAYCPDLVVVCYGLNDVNKGIEGLSDYAEALEGIFKALKAAGIETVFMTPNMMGTRVTAEIRDSHIRAVLGDMAKRQTEGEMDTYMERAREVCAQNQVPVCDCYARWKVLEKNGADVTRLLANRINHPLEELHWLFAAALFEMIMGM